MDQQPESGLLHRFAQVPSTPSSVMSYRTKCESDMGNACRT